MHVVSFAPGEILSGCCKEASPCPFFSLQFVLCFACAPTNGPSVPLGRRLGLVQPASLSGMGTALLTTPWALVNGPNPLPLGTRRGSSSVQGLWLGAMSGQELRVSWHFSVPVPGWNSYLGSRRGSERRGMEKGLAVVGSSFPSLYLLDRLFLRGFQHTCPSTCVVQLLVTGTLNTPNLEEADVMASCTHPHTP